MPVLAFRCGALSDRVADCPSAACRSAVASPAGGSSVSVTVNGIRGGRVTGVGDASYPIPAAPPRFSVAARLYRPADVARLIPGHGAALAAGGSVVGIAIASVPARYLRSFLYGVAAFDPMTYSRGRLLVRYHCRGLSRVCETASMTDPIRLLRDVV
jgi:hypothetical protein